MNLSHLDAQLRAARHASEIPDLPEQTWQYLATTIHTEITALDEPNIDRLRKSMRIPPESYREELEAFQSWMGIAHANASNPIIVRAQVMTELYVAFVWLRESVHEPLARVLGPDTTFTAITRFFKTNTGVPNRTHRFRNAIAHGRWRYLEPIGTGIEFWDGKSNLQRYEVSESDLEAWQLLSRGTSIAAILALTEGQA